MEANEYNERFKKIILDMTQEEFQNYSNNNRGPLKYIEGKIDSIIEDSINDFSEEELVEQIYKRTSKKGSYQENISEIGKIIKSEELFKSKGELIKFAKYLNLDINNKQSYKIILKKISSHIYLNKGHYANKYEYYIKDNNEYLLEPEVIKDKLVEIYRCRARNDMKSIARILNIETSEDEGAEEIRKKVINCIIKDKLRKIKN